MFWVPCKSKKNVKLYGVKHIEQTKTKPVENLF